MPRPRRSPVRAAPSGVVPVRAVPSGPLGVGGVLASGVLASVVLASVVRLGVVRVRGARACVIRVRATRAGDALLRAAPAQAGACARTASSSRTAAAFSSGLLPLPHFGDCTHAGQPVRHGQVAIACRVARSHVAPSP